MEYGLVGYLGVLRRGPRPAPDLASSAPVLRSLLDDSARVEGAYVPWIPGVSEPGTLRVCDLAALGLSLRLPDRFAFDAAAPQAQRDEAIARMLR